jgi:hypothetical protein
VPSANVQKGLMPKGDGNTERVALYMRVSSEEQAERMTIKRQCGKWYAVFVGDIGEAPEARKHGAAVGIDLGLKSFLVTDSGESLLPPQNTTKRPRRGLDGLLGRSPGVSMVLPADGRLGSV